MTGYIKKQASETQIGRAIREYATDDIFIGDLDDPGSDVVIWEGEYGVWVQACVWLANNEEEK